MAKAQKSTRKARNKSISIADCDICKNIPSKISADLEHGEEKEIPPEIDKLSKIVELDDDNTPAYCTSTTRLLKCPSCGCYYYYNHYDDDGQHFMDPTFDQVVIRRYNPLTAKRFLENILNHAGSTLPRAQGQLVKAFLDGTSPERQGIAEKVIASIADAASKELQDLDTRYDALIKDLISQLQQGPTDWETKMYIIDTLCAHFLSEGNLDAITKLLINHKDPVIRTETILFIIGMATDDAPVVDIIHVPAAERTALELLKSNKAYLRELSQILLDVAIKGEGTTLDFSKYSKTKHVEKPLQIAALYGLVVAAGHIDLSFAIPAIVTLLPGDARLNYQACWALKSIAERSKKRAQLVLDEIAKLSDDKKQELSKDQNFTDLLAECKKRLRKKK